MSDERIATEFAAETGLNNTESAKDSSIDRERDCDWEGDIEALNALIVEESVGLAEKICDYFTDLGALYASARKKAEEAGEQKKLKAFARREMKGSYRKDAELGLRLVQWKENIDRPKETGLALRTIFSEVGLGVAFGLLAKLPDTYNKINVRADDGEFRRRVANEILDELVGEVQVANETDPKNDLAAARVGQLVRAYTLPEVGDRVVFDKTFRGTVIEELERGEGTPDAAIVRIDNSGEEKILLRGAKKIEIEPPARLHEAAIVRGDSSPALYGKTVVVKDCDPETGIAEVLLLDGTRENFPVRNLVKAKPKEAKVVGDLLHLVSESGSLEKTAIAIERAEKPLKKQIEELNSLLDLRYEEGQIKAASELREQGKLGDFKPEAFLALPIEKKIEVFTAMPENEIQTAIRALSPKPENADRDEKPDAVIEPSPLDQLIVNTAERRLKMAFSLYQANREVEKALKHGDPRPKPPHEIFHEAISSAPEVKEFLIHPDGKYFLAAIATGPWGGIVDCIKNDWKVENAEEICDRISEAAAEVCRVADLFRVCEKEKIAPLDPRLKMAAQFSGLTGKERTSIKEQATSAGVKAEVEGRGKPDRVERIRDFLLTNHYETAIGMMAQDSLSLSQIISPEELQEFCDKGEKQSAHVERVLGALKEENYLSF